MASPYKKKEKDDDDSDALLWRVSGRKQEDINSENLNSEKKKSFFRLYGTAVKNDASRNKRL
eukprot:scaffold2341_cov212-Skeletonema_menzelii.AAC.9